MKTLLIFMIGVITFGTTLPVLAGPNWQIIEQGRKAKLAQMKYGDMRQAAGFNNGTVSAHESNDDQKAQMMKACMEMMKKPS